MSEREGYLEDFIGSGITVHHPTFSPRTEGAVLHSNNLRDEIYLDYIHYTLVMNRKTRQLLYVASNIDQDKLQNFKRGGEEWATDSRLADEFQLDNAYYRGTDNPYDRGHMVRRLNNCWGDSVADIAKANDDTFFYTNASLQHENFNQDEWLALEDLFLKWGLSKNGRLCVLTGPVHRPFDRCFHLTWDDAARIPSAFFKIICYQGKESGRLETRAFLLYQDEEFTNNQKSGGKILRSTKFANYQVSIADIENLTGLDFDERLPRSNPIYYNQPLNRDDARKVYRYPERVPILLREDLVHDILANRETQEADDADKILDIISALPNPKGRDAKNPNEWIMLLNKTNETVPLENWQILNQGGQVMRLEGEIDAHDTLKVRTKDHKGFSLGNKEGILVLRNPKHETVDIATYTKAEVQEDVVVRF